MYIYKPTAVKNKKEKTVYSNNKTDTKKNFKNKTKYLHQHENNNQKAKKDHRPVDFQGNFSNPYNVKGEKPQEKNEYYIEVQSIKKAHIESKRKISKNIKCEKTFLERKMPLSKKKKMKRNIDKTAKPASNFISKKKKHRKELINFEKTFKKNDSSLISASQVSRMSSRIQIALNFYLNS